MDTHFPSAKRKIERSIAHINAVEKWLWTINQENWEVAREYKKDDPSRNLDDVIVRRRKGYSDPLGPMIGDAIHNIRSALDAIAWAIVNAAGGTEKQLRSLYFPLCSVSALSESSHYKSICAAIPELGPVIVDFLQSYTASPACDLWALNELDRINKHRFVTPTVTHSSGRAVAIYKRDEDNPPTIAPGAIYSLPQERIDGVLSPKESFRPGSRAFNHNQQSGYSVVSVRFKEVLEGEDVIPKLWKFSELVNKLIDDLDAKVFQIEADETVNAGTDNENMDTAG